jgi:ABC-type multidrug transport system permease subunit
VYDQERQDKVYSPFAFVLSYRLSHLFTEGNQSFITNLSIDILVPLLYSSITYFMSRFRSGPSHFFTFFTVNLLNHFSTVTFAMWCVSIRRSFAEASLIANMLFTFMSFSAGYFIQSQSLPVYVRWTKYLSYIYWGFATLSSDGNSSWHLTNNRIP